MNINGDLMDSSRLRWLAVSVALLGHGVAIAALAMVVPPTPDVAPAVVLAVTWVGEEAPPTPPAAPVTQPRRKPVKRPPKPVVPAEPATVMAEAPSEKAVEQMEAPTTMAALAPETTPTTGAGEVVPEPQPLVAPRFDADYLSNPAPIYPATSRHLGEEGKVFLQVRVTAAGEPAEVGIRNSSGFDRLDMAAFDAVRRWKFVPARQGDVAVAAWVVVPISFSLRRLP